jgi:hypothetical protein
MLFFYTYKYFSRWSVHFIIKQSGMTKFSSPKNEQELAKTSGKRKISQACLN